MEKRILSIEELLAVPDADQITELLDLPGIGQVRIKAFSKATHSRMLREATRPPDKKADGTLDPGGDIDDEAMERLALVYGLAEPIITLDQAEQLRQKTWGAVQVLLNRIWMLSGMNRFGQITQVAVDDAEKRFRK